MLDLYKIEGCSNNHSEQLDGPEYNDPNYYPEFQTKLEEFKKMITDKIEKKQGFVVMRIYDGEFSHLKGINIQGQCSRKLDEDFLNIFKEGCYKVDILSVQLNINMEKSFKQLFPDLTISFPMDIIYGLVSNKWILKKFRNKIGLIGGEQKINCIKKLMEFKQYQEFLHNDYFTDYIEVPETLSSDNPEKIIEDISKKIENSEAELFLYGIGIVKMAIAYQFKKYKNCVFLDIGHGMSALAGVADLERPYFGNWINYRMKKYNYRKMDKSIVHTNLKINKNTFWLS